MPILVEQADIPYAPQQVFDLVADIENYPKFLRHIASARIRHRNGNTLLVDQVVRLKMLRLRFSTRTVLDRPSRIHVVCTDSMFGTFDEQWAFAPSPSGGTHLLCRTEYRFRSDLLRMALNATLAELFKTTVEAFESRGRQLYGRDVASG
jgi:coenzyme Q-binding protein COQ10